MQATSCRICVLLIALLLAGCRSGPPLGQVKGTVSYRGKPVPNGTVMFVPDVPGTVAIGSIQPDGNYKLATASAGEGALLGTHKVVIMAIQDMKGVLPEDRNPTPPSIIPDKYTSLATTPLTGEVKAGENVINFDLKD